MKRANKLRWQQWAPASSDGPKQQSGQQQPVQKADPDGQQEEMAAVQPHQ